MAKKIIRAPDGFQVRYRIHVYNKQIENVYCDLYDLSKPSHKRVGLVELERGFGKTFYTHSELNHEYHNRKLGTLLYSKAIAWAINHGFKVRSSGSSSELAKRVWNGKGLRKHFKIRKVTTDSYTYDIETWYAYKR